MTSHSHSVRVLLIAAVCAAILSAVGISSTQITSLSGVVSQELSSLFATPMSVQVIGGVAGVAVGGALGWLFKTRKRRFVSSCLTRMSSTYDEFYDNKEECRKRLTQMKKESLQLFKEGKIDENHLTMMDRKLEEYLKELGDETPHRHQAKRKKRRTEKNLNLRSALYWWKTTS